MHVIGIDPGSEKSGLVCIYWDNRKGVRVTDVRRIWANEKILKDLRELAARGTEDALLAIETPCYVGGGKGKAKGKRSQAGRRPLIETILWTGRFIEAWEQGGGKVRKIERHQVYKHVCPGAKGSDVTVRRGLIARFGRKGTKKDPGPMYGMKDHMWAALAVAVTAAETKG